MAFYNFNAPIFPDTIQIQEEINQLQQTSAVAPFIQTENSLATWATSATGPLSDHNLLKNNSVKLSDEGDFSNINSLQFIGSTGTTGLYDDGGSLFYNGSPVGGGSGDVTGGGVSAVNEIATYNALTGKSIGRSGLNAKYTTTNIFMSPGPIPSLSGGQENIIITSATIPSPVSTSVNTFVGTSAGNATASGYNTGIGSRALALNTDVSGSNTAVGALALATATSVALSTAVGTEAGENMLTSTNNTLIGHRAGYSFEDANSCVMIGTFAGGFELGTPVNGAIDNIFIGKQAGYSAGMSDSVLGNICIGALAGSNITDNTFNIYLDHAGVAGEDGVIRIGQSGIHTKNFQMGIFGVTTDVVDAIPVLVDSAGQLGTVSSSIKYKENVKDLENSEIIYKLRPVEFNMIKHPNNKSIGLIAEEVEKIYPEMCIYQDGSLYTVDYSRLTILMLSEIQKLKNEISRIKQM